MSQAKALQSTLASSESSLRGRWKNCLKKIKEELPWQTFETWFTPIIPVAYVDEKLILRIPSRFFYEWIDSHYGKLLRRVVREEFGLRTSVEYSVVPTETEAKLPLPEEGEEESPEPGTGSEPIPQLELELDARLVFENFHTGGDNELALKAAQHVARQAGQPAYNPLLIFGKTGTGKSHLLQAIAHQFVNTHKRKRIKLVSSERFLNDYVLAVQEGITKKLHRTYLNIDLLLVEDVHLLAHKKRTQEGLLYIAGELVKKKKQVVFSSALAPAQMSGFEPRFISFLQKGLIVDLIPPELTTRRKIVASYFQNHGIRPDNEIVDFLATNIPENMHLLYSALVRIIAQESLLKKTVTLEQVQFIVAQLFPHWNGVNGLASKKKDRGMDNIVEMVSDYFGIPGDVLRGRTRKKEIVLARQIAMYLVRELTGESLARIGYHFTDLHHSSVLYACKRIEQQMKENPMLRNTVEHLRSKILGA